MELFYTHVPTPLGEQAYTICIYILYMTYTYNNSSRMYRRHDELRRLQVHHNILDDQLCTPILCLMAGVYFFSLLLLLIAIPWSVTREQLDFWTTASSDISCIILCRTAYTVLLLLIIIIILCFVGFLRVCPPMINPVCKFVIKTDNSLWHMLAPASYLL